MFPRARLLAALALAFATQLAQADPQDLERARGLLAAGNPKQAYAELAKLEPTLAGQPEFDYLLGVAALDSGATDAAIVAFERVLAVMPNHAGAQMDLARAYYATGSFDLAEAGFTKLRGANPPAGAKAAIERYLEAIRERRQQVRAGWTGYGELGLGYDSNLTGVPTDFGAAAQQSFNLTGIEATGNAVKRKAGFVMGNVGAEYAYPLSRGWSLFGGGDLRGRAYKDESDFNLFAGEVRAGAFLNQGQDQWRFSLNGLYYQQEGAAPGDPKPTNDRTMVGGAMDWRHAIDPRNQVHLGVQLNAVRFPENRIEDFDQVYLSTGWLRSFEGKGVPILYLSAYVTDDKAKNTFPDTDVGKSKNLFGVRSYFQYSLSDKVQLYNALGYTWRRDKDSYARSTQVEKGKDQFGELLLGVSWVFRPACMLRTQVAYTRNQSNIDIYDFNRYEILSSIRCDMN
jgi:tetratricopeptide (TPR) repeat protein